MSNFQQTAANDGLKAPESPDTSNWWTREESSDFLGVSIQTLRNYEHRKRLHPLHAYRKDGYGIERYVTIYDPAEVNKLPRGARKQRLHGELSASVFELFNAGKNLREVVVEMRESPGTIKELHTLWLEGGERAETRADLAVRCFKLFNEGKALQEIVIELHEDPDVIRDLKEHWMNNGGADITITPLAKKELERLVGPFKTVADLVDQITAKLNGVPAIAD